MADIIIRTEALTKFYGKVKAVSDLNLEIAAGEVFGYLGPNGAGKTTTIRMLLDFIRPTSGKAFVFGLDSRVQSVAIKKRIGYMPGDIELYKKLTGGELLRFFANLRGGVDWNRVKELADRFDSDLTKPIKSLSSGNKQKLGLIQAFMHQPELLVLDEPTTGLDPLMQQEFHNLIRETAAEGRTVLLSSHILPEVERACDRVAIIRLGSVAAVENISKLKSKALRTLEIHFASPIASADFSGLKGVKDLRINNNILTCTVRGSLDELIKKASTFEVINIISHEPNLEEIFLTFYGGDNHAQQHSA